MTEGRILQKGDVIYYESPYRFGKFQIESVTQKFAFGRNTRLYRIINEDGSIRDVERNSQTDYYIETPEIKQEFLIKRMRSRIGKFDWSLLDDQAIITLYELIKPYINKAVSNDEAG